MPWPFPFPFGAHWAESSRASAKSNADKNRKCFMLGFYQSYIKKTSAKPRFFVLIIQFKAKN